MNKTAMRAPSWGLLTFMVLGCVPDHVVGSDVLDGSGLETVFRNHFGAEGRDFDPLQTFRSEGSIKQQFANGSKKAWRVKLTRKGPFACLERTTVDSAPGRAPPQVEVFCRGPRYSFVLEREDSRNPFRVRYFNPKGQPEQKGALYSLDMALAHVAGCNSRILFIRLPELVRDPGFAVKSIAERETGGRRLVDLSYSCSTPDAPSPSGTIEFDPDLDWAIVRFSVKEREQRMRKAGSDEWDIVNASFEGGNQYSALDGRAFPKSFSNFEKREQRVATSYEGLLERVETPAVDDGEFSLTAYGVPEIAVSPSEVPWFFSRENWVFWASFSTAVIAFLVLRLTALRMRRAASRPG